MKRYIMLIGQNIQYCGEVNYPKLIYKYPQNIPQHFFVKIGKLTLKFIWQFKEPGIAKTTLRKKRQMRGLNFKIYHKAIVFKTVWCWHKDIQINQQNTVKSSEINLYGMNN